MGSSLVHYLFLIFLLLSITQVQSIRSVFNVNTFGAIGDGKTNNYKAILAAWNKACQSVGGGVVLIPKGTYLMSSVDFIGPCKGQMVFELQGILKAPVYQPDQSNSDHWIAFRYVDNLIIGGGGTFDGQGPTAWPYRKCDGNPNYCKQLPISLRLDFVRKAAVTHIRLVNSMNFHMNIFSCQDIRLDHLHISAPGDSPNTDGIHLGDSTAVKITNSIITTGDDCISFGPGMRDVEVRGVHCGPGHGISIGSLGKYPNEHDVVGFVIKNCSFSGTQNGLRIKTWALPSKPILVYNVTFEQIIMDYVNNPVIIDQEYCPSSRCSRQGYSQVQIRGVKFRNIRGTSSSKVAVNLKCSKIRPCQQIELRDISLTYHGKDGRETSQCSYAHGVAYGYEQPQSCLM